MEAIKWLAEHYDEILAIIGALLTVASIVTKLTPTPKDDEVLRQLLAWFSVLQPRGQGSVKLPFSKPRSDDDKPPPSAGPGATMLLFILVGCGGAQADIDTARRAIELTSEAGAAADRVVAYECYRAPEPRADEHASECSTATDALVTARRTLQTAQEGVDAWQAGEGDGGAVQALSCIAGALGRAQEAMAAAGLPIPGKLGDALRLAARFGRAQCDGGE